MSIFELGRQRLKYFFWLAYFWINVIVVLNGEKVSSPNIYDAYGKLLLLIISAENRVRTIDPLHANNDDNDQVE